MIKSFSDYVTESRGDVTIVFGRFNPPTSGHEKLFEALKKASRGGTYRIYASKSQDPKKNPLQFKEKVKFLRKMFPKHARNIMADSDTRTVIDVAVKLYEQGFTKLSMVAGSDRIKEFEILLNKYNGVEARHGFYQFEGSIRVVSAGERDPDSDDVSGMSASKMRAAAEANDLTLFSKGMPKGYRGAIELFNAVRKGMGLKESKSFRTHVELPKVSETREKFVEGNLFKVGEHVKINDSGKVGTIINCGANYLTLALSEGSKKKVWLDSVEKLDEKAYGDMNAKQKASHDKPRKDMPQSKHTKNFKKKFGEMKSFAQTLEEADVKKALQKKADKSGMPYSILKKVFDRGFEAWKSTHRPGTNPTQWGLARVNSFATKSSGTWGKADADLAAKVKG